MLKIKEAFSSFSVDKLEKAKAFYSGTLGLEISPVPEMEMLLELKIGTDGSVIIYSKENHEPASFTILNFPVDNIDSTVDELIKKGVEFEQYTGEIQTDEKGISRGKPNVAWFKDPAGNIISLIEM